jgi:pimeloyl-ACP methyl ester carboxylesterase
MISALCWLMAALAIGGEKAFGELLGQQLKVVASNAKVVVLENTGHWMLEENPKQKTEALITFL